MLNNIAVSGAIGSVTQPEPIDRAYVIELHYDGAARLYVAVLVDTGAIGQGETRAAAMRDLGQVLDEWAEDFIEG